MKIDRAGYPFIAGALVPAAVLAAARRHGWAASLTALAVTAGLVWTLGSELVYDPWQPNVLILTFWLVMCLVWATAADHVGSTEVIIQTLEAAPAGSAWALGTELNLVKRLAAQHTDKQVVFLDRTVCFCSTMNRIDLPHLVWSLESLVEGRVVNRIRVDDDTAHWARVALEQMLALPSSKAQKD